MLPFGKCLLIVMASALTEAFMNVPAGELEVASQSIESIRLQLERAHRELNEQRVRMAELRKAEALLAGEKRLLEMIARGEALEPILNALCRSEEHTSELQSHSFI